MPVRGRRQEGSLEGDVFHSPKIVLQKLVRLRLDPGGDAGLGGSPVRWVVLEAAVRGGLWDGVTTIPSTSPDSRPPVVRQDSRGETAGVGVYASPGASMTSTSFAASTSSARCRCRYRRACVSMPRNSGPLTFFLPTVQADRLHDGEDVPLVERPVERGAAMPGGSEVDSLRRHGRVGPVRVVGRDEAGGR